MKFGEIIVATLVLFSFPNILQAQQSDTLIHKNVTVERNFVPVVQPAGRVEAQPAVSEPQKKLIDADYADFESPLSLSGNIHPLGAAKLLFAQQSEKRPGFARLALGLYPNTLADFAYPLVSNSNMRLDAVVRQRGAYNGKYTNEATAHIAFDRYFGKWTLFAGLESGYQGVRYYGMNFNSANEDLYFSRLLHDDLNVKYTETDFMPIGREAKSLNISDLKNRSQFGHIWRAGTNLGFRSAANAQNWRYLGQIFLNTFHHTAGITENMLHTTAQVGFNFNENRVGADIDLYNASYSSLDTINYYKNYGVVRLSPYFEFNQIANLKLRMGVLLAVPFAGEQRVKFAPDLRLDWKAEPKYLNVYAGLSGKYKVNSMSDLFHENPYLATDVRVMDTHTPFDFYGGVLVKPMDGLLIDFFVDYSITTNQYFFINKPLNNPAGNIYQYTNADSVIYTNRFDVVYDRSELFIGGLRVDYNYRDKFRFDFSGKYFTGPLDTQLFPWHQPQWDFHLNAACRVTKDINITFSGYFQTGMMAKLGQGNLMGTDIIPMKTRIDLNLGGAYNYSEWLTVFLNINNLLNSKYDIFYGYEVQGFNAMVGAALSF